MAENDSLVYEPIPRRWRPQTFDQVIGQEVIIKTLQNAIRQDRISHAFLFSGDRGVGKTTTARILAKALNCEKGPTPEPCNECDACEEIAQSASLDVLEIDGASNRKVEEIQELKENVIYAPARDRNRVFIIDEVHMLSKHAFNSLLKTLEEPPPHVVFIFATTEPRKVPTTIHSRCQHYAFQRIPGPLIIECLQKISQAEKRQVDPTALRLITIAAEGSLRDAESLLDQLFAFTEETITEETVRAVLGLIEREQLFAFIGAILTHDSSRILHLIEELIAAGYDEEPLLSDLLHAFRDLLIIKTVDEPKNLLPLPQEENESYQALAADATERDLIRIMNLLEQTIDPLRWSIHPRHTLELALLKAAELPQLRAMEDVLTELRSVSPSGDHVLSSRSKEEPSSLFGDDEPKSDTEKELPDAAGHPTPTPDATPEERFLSLVQERKRSLHTLLQSSEGVKISEKTITIQFAPGEKKGLIQQVRAKKDVLKEIAEEAFGEPRNILFQEKRATEESKLPSPSAPSAEQAAPRKGSPAEASPRERQEGETPDTPPQERRRDQPSEAPARERRSGAHAQARQPERKGEQRRAEIEKSPAVQSVLEIFEGELLDVKPQGEERD